MSSFSSLRSKSHKRTTLELYWVEDLCYDQINHLRQSFHNPGWKQADKN